MTLYQLEITTETPMHIGSGAPPLRKHTDFLHFEPFTYVLDMDAILDHIVPRDGDYQRIDEITRSANLQGFVTEQDVQQHPELYIYRLRGSSSVREIHPQIKDVWHRPYVPGSTLKGAIRTALGTQQMQSEAVTITTAQLGPRREWAARDLEHMLLSSTSEPRKAPNYDLLRAIQVADSAPVDRGSLDLINVAVWPTGQRGIPIDVEAIRPQTTFTARVKLDDYLLGPAARDLRWGSRVQTLQQWVQICREHGVALIKQELQFFAGKASAVERFYADFLRRAEQAPPTTFFVQLGWGTGWHSKTLSRVIAPNGELLAQIIQRYRLARGTHRSGMPFPKTRHVVTDRGQPRLPLGWVAITVRDAL